MATGRRRGRHRLRGRQRQTDAAGRGRGAAGRVRQGGRHVAGGGRAVPPENGARGAIPDRDVVVMTSPRGRVALYDVPRRPSFETRAIRSLRCSWLVIRPRTMIS